MGPTSRARERGVAAVGLMDIDLGPHFYGSPDLGADEYWPRGALKRLYMPAVVWSWGP